IILATKRGKVEMVKSLLQFPNANTMTRPFDNKTTTHCIEERLNTHFEDLIETALEYGQMEIVENLCEFYQKTANPYGLFDNYFAALVSESDKAKQEQLLAIPAIREARESKKGRKALAVLLKESCDGPDHVLTTPMLSTWAKIMLLTKAAKL